MQDTSFSMKMWGIISPLMKRDRIVWNLTDWKAKGETAVEFKLNKRFFTGLVTIVDTTMVEGTYTIFLQEDGMDKNLPVPNDTFTQEEMIEFFDRIGTVYCDWKKMAESDLDFIQQICGNDEPLAFRALSNDFVNNAVTSPNTPCCP